jgi:hypothetical protein
MNEKDLKEIERLFYEYKRNECKETAGDLKYFLIYCSKEINLKKMKSKQIKF